MCLQGKFYLIIEELSQLFRSLVPIQLWYKYIMGDDASNSYFLGGVLIILYSLCKVRCWGEDPLILQACWGAPRNPKSSRD